MTPAKPQKTCKQMSISSSLAFSSNNTEELTARPSNSVMYLLHGPPFHFNLASSNNISPRKTINTKSNLADIAHKYSVFIVLDTNIFLHQLVTLKKTLAISIRQDNAVSFLFIIPGIVIEELDHQKTRPSISSKARAASSWILENLRTDSMYFRGQKEDETLKDSGDWKARLPKESNDDLIVDCCRFYDRHRTTLLCSSDVNICAKAEINDVKTISPTTATSWDPTKLLEVITQFHPRSTSRAKRQRLYVTPRTPTPTSPTTPSTPILKKAKSRVAQVHSPLSRSALKDTSNTPQSNRSWSTTTRKVLAFPASMQHQSCISFNPKSGCFNPRLALESMNVDIQPKSVPALEKIHKESSALFATLIRNLFARQTPNSPDKLNSRQISGSISASVYDCLISLAELKDIPLDAAVFSFFQKTVPAIYLYGGEYAFTKTPLDWECAMRGLRRLGEEFSDSALTEAVHHFDVECFAALFSRRMK
ncbi:PIN domain-containing protein [Flagelloscypha sp. PMI_526]|nr:PIN domain-containing protein [Flagelloscypha sp. PMI_526]